jgi:multimeric flavodoxin WrbA
MKKILLLNGSPSSNGNTAFALEAFRNTITARGIECELLELGKAPVQGCIHCQSCKDSFRCCFKNDLCNELIEKLSSADGLVVGSPVYFTGPNGSLCALLDRVFYAGSNYGNLFTGKAGAAVVTAWREGGSASIDRLNKYFSFAQMPVISSNYWNVVLGKNDEYGLSVIRKLAENMADYLKN